MNFDSLMEDIGNAFQNGQDYFREIIDSSDNDQDLLNNMNYKLIQLNILYPHVFHSCGMP